MRKVSAENVKGLWELSLAEYHLLGSQDVGANSVGVGPRGLRGLRTCCWLRGWTTAGCSPEGSSEV